LRDKDFGHAAGPSQSPNIHQFASERQVATLMSWAGTLLQFCDRAVSGGYLVALVLICALQYLYHLLRSHRAGELRERLYRQIDDARSDLRSVSRDRTLTSLENQILRDFTGELDLDRTLDQLIRRLVGETKDGFAAYVPVGARQGDVTLARGLSEQSRENLVIDSAYLDRVRKEGIAVFSKVEVYGSRLYENLAAIDRARFEKLFLCGIGTADDLAGVILTTSLFPVGIPLDEQIELAKRLMRSLGGIVKRTEELQSRDRQLQSMKEIMELRTVTDQKHRSPLDMIEAFVDRLREMAQADRAVLFLANGDGKNTYKPLCRCGVALETSISKNHADLEMILAESDTNRTEPEFLDCAALGRVGIDTLIGSAIVAPVTSPNGIAGSLCLTRAAKKPFTNVRPELMTWAARYLSDTVLRVLHQAVAEWHARQDPLTDLSNRRTFDREFAATLQAASASGGTCCLLMVDIDRFKSINDRNGHLIGDEVLRCVSRVLKESVSRLSGGSPGLAARYGGEEFAVLLPGVHRNDGAWIAETLRAAVEIMPIRTPQSQINVTISVGAAVFPEHARSAEELLLVADAALYEAKETGRNRIVMASPAVTV
jgi:diguanylate cyclase (GGDEF)-like protein